MPRRTYQGGSVAELLLRAQRDLGPGAVILRVTQKRSALGGPLIEIEAGDEADAAAARAVPSPAVRPAPRAPAAPGAPRAAVPVAAPRAPQPAGRLTLALVGPTGAGKTSTIAKLAGYAGIFGTRSVGLLGLDTYKAGAVEELQTLGGLAGRPVAIAYDLADLPRARKALADCDVVLVDCPGRGPRTGSDSESVAALLRALAPAETHLVLSAGLQEGVVRRHVQAYRRFGITHLLATKLDECPDDWTPFDVAAAEGLPMRWLADGQRIPHDLRAADARLEAARQSLRRARPTAQAGVA